ncbi:hypothetical protein PMAYCL1PPCAC_08439 [Pristionchus mayeri]|uniref:Uncharacterized protein n=1 Tax=Pristionchus mayeri TaxID=1317129 RepID=A0AAN4ZE06_9BILA|nr:hypothetical protein PMAYCL1PPCAC_08439 [Pristionchus mayeri]
MINIVNLLLLSATSDALITFKNSQLIQQSDISPKGPYPNGVQFPCPGSGCTMYATQTLANSVGIYKGDKHMTSLDKIYKVDNDYLVGYHLEGGSDYRIKQTSTISDTFKIYIVSDVAVVDISFGLSKPLDASGKRIVTILSARWPISFSNYVGVSAPKIYSAGFDSVDHCKPVYTSRSVANAADSDIGI